MALVVNLGITSGFSIVNLGAQQFIDLLMPWQCEAITFSVDTATLVVPHMIIMVLSRFRYMTFACAL